MKRRDALKIIGAGGTAVLAACNPKASPPPAEGVKVGDLSEFAQVNAYKRFIAPKRSDERRPGEVTYPDLCTNAYVFRTDTLQPGGLDAGNGVFLVSRSLVCTHQGCVIGRAPSAQNTVRCSCHAATFDLKSGAAVENGTGVPLEPLPAFELELRADGVYALPAAPFTIPNDCKPA